MDLVKMGMLLKVGKDLKDVYASLGPDASAKLDKSLTKLVEHFVPEEEGGEGRKYFLTSNDPLHVRVAGLIMDKDSRKAILSIVKPTPVDVDGDGIPDEIIVKCRGCGLMQDIPLPKA